MTANSFPIPGTVVLPSPVFSSQPQSNPVDGQEWIFPAAAGINWRFRYNLGSSSSYKWEFIGGPALVTPALGPSSALYFSAPAGAAGTNTNWLSDAGSPNLIVTRAGEYQTVLSGYGSVAQPTGEVRNVYEGLMKQDGGVGQFLYTGIRLQHGFQAIQWQASPAYFATEVAVAVAASVLQMYYGADAASAAGVNYTFSSRVLSILPKRVT